MGRIGIWESDPFYGAAAGHQGYEVTRLRTKEHSSETFLYKLYNEMSKDMNSARSLCVPMHFNGAHGPSGSKKLSGILKLAAHLVAQQHLKVYGNRCEKIRHGRKVIEI